MTNMVRRITPDTKESPATPTQVDVARENIVERCADLERISTAALEIAAEAVAALHKKINGRAADLCGNRPAKYFRQQLRGEDPLTGEDIARLAVQAPADLVAWLQPILAAVAHGAPAEMADALAEVIQVVDLRLQQTRESLGELESRVSAWKETR